MHILSSGGALHKEHGMKERAVAYIAACDADQTEKA